MTVHLVGAGPGDPDLLTVKAARLLATADVVVHDRLASPEIRALVRVDAELIDVGKRPGAPTPQENINALLVHLGAQGLEVVRLKGGDPFVFGRGGEEADALAAAGIDFDVVPGVTSALAAPAAAGIPVTHRGVSGSFTVVTGHRERDGASGVAWEALAEAGGTIVVLMGVSQRGLIAQRLMAGGLAADTPVAAVRWGTTADQSTLRTTLGGLAAAPVEAPSTIVIGAVAAYGFVAGDDARRAAGLDEDVALAALDTTGGA